MRFEPGAYVRDPFLIACTAAGLLASYHLATAFQSGVHSGSELYPSQGPNLGETPVRAQAHGSAGRGVSKAAPGLKAPGVWWVDASGSAGSDARRLDEISSRLKPGDRIRLGPGEYHAHLKIDFDLEISTDSPREVLVIADEGPAIEQSGGTLKLTGIRLRQGTGEVLVSRDSTLQLRQVALLGRGGSLASFERSRLKGESAFFMTESSVLREHPSSIKLVDSPFDCSQCSFERVVVRASGERSPEFRLEDPAFRMGSLTLAGRVDATILGATFLGTGSDAVPESDSPRIEIGLEDDARLKLRNTVFDRSGVALADRASAEIRMSKFSAIRGPVILARGRSAVRIGDTEFAQNAALAVVSGPDAKVDRPK